MLVMKLALVTCAVYMGITVVLFACEIALVHLQGEIFYSLNWRAFGLLFGLLWLVSFSVAWRIVISHIAARSA